MASFLRNLFFSVLLCAQAFASLPPIPLPADGEELPPAKRCIHIVPHNGRAELVGDLTDPFLTTHSAVAHSTPFHMALYDGENAEVAYGKHRPLGLRPLVSDVPVPTLSEAQATRMNVAIETMKAKQQGPAWMINRILIRMIATEAQFLRENVERYPGLREAANRLEREKKKPHRVLEYRQEADFLQAQVLQLEESILAKYAEFVKAPIALERMMGDYPGDMELLADAVYAAALYRAQRLGTPHREITLQNKFKAIEYLPEGDSDITKLVKTVQRITKVGDTPFRVVFTPHANLADRHATRGNYLDEHGNFGLTVEYLLFGKADAFLTPLQLRGLQLLMMQKSGALTPFRGLMTQDAHSVGNLAWTPIYMQVLQGAHYRHLVKGLPPLSQAMKVEIARELHDGLNDHNQLFFLGGAFLVQRLTSRAIGKLTLEHPPNLKVYFLEAAVAVDLTDERNVVDERVSVLRTKDGIWILVIESRHVKFKLPLHGKDMQAGLADLLPVLLSTAPNKQLTRVHREAIVRLLRGIQRSVDVAQNLQTSMDEGSARIRESANAYVQAPGPDTEANLIAALKAYKEPKLDRLSLRGTEPPPETEEEPTELPAGYEGPVTPEHLLLSLRTARGMGTSSSAWRTAVERIGIHAVRTFLEQRDFDTLDRGPDQQGFDIKAMLRNSKLPPVYLEVKAVSDIAGMVSFTPGEILFARTHRAKGDWVLAIVVVDKAGASTIHFRRGVDLGKPLPAGIERRPFLVHDLLTLGHQVAAEEVGHAMLELPAAEEAP